jgi:hypothetical protein
MPKPPASRSLTVVASLARGHTEKSINVLAGIMQNRRAPPMARIRAAEILLNRGWGQPVQHFEKPDGATPISKIVHEIVFMKNAEMPEIIDEKPEIIDSEEPPGKGPPRFFGNDN